MTMSIKKVLTGTFAVALVALLAVFATGCGGGSGSGSGESSGGEGKYKPGEYTGEGTGMGGKIQVKLTVDENAITAVDITDPGETAGYPGKQGIEDGTFVDQIMEAQSAEIDGVSGGTITSTGVKNAVEDALEQAAA